MLEALLTDNRRLRVLLAVNMLHHDHPEELYAACPVLGSAPTAYEPASFWMEVAE